MIVIALELDINQWADKEKPSKYIKMVYIGIITISLPTFYLNIENKEADYYLNEVMCCSVLFTF